MVNETASGRYRVEASGVATPAVTAAVATFLAERGATLTDLVAGKTLEDVYFETVGAAAVTAAGDDAADDTADDTAAGRADTGRRRRGRGRGRERRRAR